VENEKNIKSSLNEMGKRTYYISKRNLLQAGSAAHNLSLLNTALKGHL
jgi:hypothetical protein